MLHVSAELVLYCRRGGHQAQEPSITKRRSLIKPALPPSSLNLIPEYIGRRLASVGARQFDRTGVAIRHHIGDVCRVLLRRERNRRIAPAHDKAHWQGDNRAIDAHRYRVGRLRSHCNNSLRVGPRQRDPMPRRARLRDIVDLYGCGRVLVPIESNLRDLPRRRRYIRTHAIH